MEEHVSHLMLSLERRPFRTILTMGHFGEKKLSRDTEMNKATPHSKKVQFTRKVPKLKEYLETSLVKANRKNENHLQRVMPQGKECVSSCLGGQDIFTALNRFLSLSPSSLLMLTRTVGKRHLKPTCTLVLYECSRSGSAAE